MLTALALLLACLPQEPLARVHLDLHAGSVARRHAPVVLHLDAPPGAVGVPLRAELDADGDRVPVQVASRDKSLEVAWVQPRLGAGERRRCTLVLRRAEGPGPRPWALRETGERVALDRGSRPVWEQHTAFDPEDHEATKKTFHHLFSPDGSVRLTKGTGGTYPHHRGLFVGWSRTATESGQYDFWHCPGEVVQRAVTATTDAELGAAFARVESTVEWRPAPDEEPVVEERRVLTAWTQPEGVTLLDVDVELRATRRAVRLGGDPHHAGVQVRLAQEVAEREDAEYWRASGATAEGNDVWNGGDWVAARATVDGRPWLVAQIAHPDNPPPRVWSTRPYGRFGAFCSLRLRPGRARHLRYRLLVVDLVRHPDSSPADVAARAADYAEGIRVVVLPR